jgi:hypothetical protein
MSSPFESAAAEARKLIAEQTAILRSHPAMIELVRLHAGLNAIEDLMQQPRTALGELLNLGDLGGASPLSRVRFDDFVGMKDLEAAKKYLEEKATDARPFQEIVDAVKAGGSKVDSEEALRTGLSRSTYEILKIGDRYGALKHYPQVKRGGKKRKGSDSGESADVVDEKATSSEEKSAGE